MGGSIKQVTVLRDLLGDGLGEGVKDPKA